MTSVYTHRSNFPVCLLGEQLFLIPFQKGVTISASPERRQLWRSTTGIQEGSVFTVCHERREKPLYSSASL